MRQAICLLSVVPMRKEPAHRSEMVSQLLFGEYASVEGEKDDFALVCCIHDGYRGWVQQNQLTAVGGEEALKTDIFTAGFATPVTKNHQLLYVPSGTPVYGGQELSFKAAGQRMDYLMQPQQTWSISSLRLNQPSLLAVAQPYLSAPYLWGGRSVFGIDCSGFAQQVLKLFGVALPRNASLQAEQGWAVEGINDMRLGDLAFFCNESGRVTHVGIVLEGGKIIHASGEVRMDALTGQGIVNTQDRRLTHTLHSFRRFF